MSERNISEFHLFVNFKKRIQKLTSGLQDRNIFSHYTMGSPGTLCMKNLNIFVDFFAYGMSRIPNSELFIHLNPQSRGKFSREY
jgi:hypothetical protein